MKKPFKILLATDYSEAAKNAERYALQFAMQTGSFLDIMHVFQPPLKVSSVPTMFDIEKIEYNPALYELRKLKEHVAKLLKSMRINPKDLKYECIVREGSASKQICEEAREVGLDFIILGSHGVGGFKQFFLGNHTWDVMKQAKTPVLAIPKNAFFTGIKNVVFITEYREGEIPAINFLTHFVSQFNAEVSLVHILGDGVSSSFEKEISVPFIKKVKAEVKYPNFSVHTIHNDNMILGLNEFCTNIKADWVTASLEKPGFLERIFSLDSTGITKKLTLYSHTPLLTLHDFFNTSGASLKNEYELENPVSLSLP